MKSRLFTELSDDRDDIKRDLQSVVGLTDAQLEALKAWLAEVGSRWHEHTGEDERRLFSATGLDASPAQGVVNFLSWLGLQMELLHDNLDDVLDDLRAIASMDDAAANRLSKRLPDLLAASGALVEAQKDLRFMRAVIPRYQSLHVAADLRARVEQEFDSDEQRIEEYAPQVACLLPVGLCRVRVFDGGRSRSISFQITPKDLDRMISDLVALQKQISLLSQLASEVRSRPKA